MGIPWRSACGTQARPRALGCGATPAMGLDELRAREAARGTDTVVEGQYYMAPVSFMWLISASAILELPRAIQSGAWRAPLNHPGPFLLSLALGAVVNYCAAAVIKLTNSVTLKVRTDTTTIWAVESVISEDAPRLTFPSAALAAGAKYCTECQPCAGVFNGAWRAHHPT
eukprot:scaffold57302_cov36-Tisochrysis_lutea.AAC.2